MADKNEWDKTGDPIPEGPDTNGLEFEPIARTREQSRSVGKMMMFVLAVLAGGAIAIWYFYGERITVDESKETPLILADKSPIKTRPQEPGGMKIPDRDKFVYDRMQGSEGAKKTIEQLLPPAEKLLPSPQEKKSTVLGKAATARSISIEPVDRQATVPTTSEVLAATPPPPPPPPPSISGQAASTAPKVTTKVTTKVTDAKVATKVATKLANKKIATAGTYQIQLAAARTRELAEREWKRLNGKHGDLLGKMKPDIVRADLGAKGIFFRLRAGPAGERTAARALCNSLIVRKVPCIIVVPPKS